MYGLKHVDIPVTSMLAITDWYEVRLIILLHRDISETQSEKNEKEYENLSDLKRIGEIIHAASNEKFLLVSRAKYS